VLTASRSTDIKSNAVAIAALYAFVLFFAPYQFALLVISLLAILATPKSVDNQAVLLLTLLLLPSNGPILVVWVRNLATGWWQPFSSDHNVFLMTGPLLWLLRSVYGEHIASVPRHSSNVSRYGARFAITSAH
jgi:glycosylphosphatidylinositol deacylase